MTRDRSHIKVRPVRKDKPDVRALARVLIELALSDASAAQQAPTTESPTDENSSPEAESAA